MQQIEINEINNKFLIVLKSENNKIYFEKFYIENYFKDELKKFYITITEDKKTLDNTIDFIINTESLKELNSEYRFCISLKALSLNSVPFSSV